MSSTDAPDHWKLAPIKGNGCSDGYTLNIHEPSGGGLGMRICQIPAFTWRSQEAVIALGERIAAVPALEHKLIAAVKALESVAYSASFDAFTLKNMARAALGLEELA